ncbi:peptidase domain-containing ABC transporter [Klebsiella michiganensis]|uniref:peptidase domain-containing ABC transporter n=1 Tax=Klebsiella michiganensis TaxID=1134687 RepID=UPI001C8C4ADE|nr:peptidase domain-containing ABC transporter [Klebsiella michiganensis]MBX8656120.1 peptidase domain-containing ABC transporter [Klebsiella michiganensis]
MDKRTTRKHTKTLIFFFTLSITTNILTLVMPLSFMAIIDRVITTTAYATLNSIMIILIVVVLFELIIDLATARLLNWLNAHITYDYTCSFLKNILYFNILCFNKFGTADIIARLNELDRVKTLKLNWLTGFITDMIFMFVYIIFMLTINISMSALVLITVPLHIIQYSVLRKKIRSYNEQLFNSNVSYNTNLIETLDGITVVKNFNSENLHYNQIQSSLSGVLYNGFKLANLNSLSSTISSLVSKLSDILVLTFDAYMIMQQKITLGELIAFNMMKDKALTPLMRLANIWDEIIQYKVSQRRINQVINENSEFQESDFKENQDVFFKSVLFDDITFSYAPDKEILKELSLSINEPGLYCILGESGCGKTTLLKLITRVVPLSKGDIRIDNRSINDISLATLRNNITFIDQANTLFTGTIRENILKYSTRKDDHWLKHCAQVAEAEEFIKHLPDGYETKISSQVSNLSGGQQQRLCIARAIARNSPILILDEATSALDELTENKVITNILEHQSDKIIISITHRLTISKMSKRVYQIEEGELITAKV